MTAPDVARARRRLASLSRFPPEEVREATIERLFGLTNEVFKVEIAGRRLCLRIPGTGTAGLIDRRREEANARAAARAGIAPEVLHFSPDGVMITRFVEGTPLSPERFRQDPGAVVRAAQALRALHDEAADFSGVFDVFERLAFYRDLLRRSGGLLAAEHDRLIDHADAIRLALGARPVPLKPCHCDPTGRNLIDAGDRIWLIDWEYSATNDPVWDLAYLSIEAGFDEPQEQALLTAYLGRLPRADERARMTASEALCQLLSALWALVQHSGGNRAANFLSYAEAALERARERMCGEDFFRSLFVLRN